MRSLLMAFSRGNRCLLWRSDGRNRSHMDDAIQDQSAQSAVLPGPACVPRRRRFPHPLSGGRAGTNTGIQDCANLAWKLAAFRANAPIDLLASYNEERGAVGEALLAMTSRGLAAATSASPTIESLRDLFLSTFGGAELVQNNMRGFISETGVRYRKSSIVRDCSGTSTVHAGDRALDVMLNDAGEERRLYDLFSNGEHVLLAVDAVGRFCNSCAICTSK